ncbi:protein AE7-like [Rutidosis leptorrhynchoides]|uniref:protein AE7-like n=1 Tax=Rutidosis leptorrhynchoides TaxID=125765 RepID=UPI003A99D6BB
MAPALINPNPVVYEKKEHPARTTRPGDSEFDEYASELIDKLEIFDHIRDIKDPEYPYSLEELHVITEDAIEVDDKLSYVRVMFTPTVKHCSMADNIGLCLRVKLMRSLPSRFKVEIKVAPGTHATEDAVNKLLNDKERVAGALETPIIVKMLDECLQPSFE